MLRGGFLLALALASSVVAFQRHRHVFVCQQALPLISTKRGATVAASALFMNNGKDELDELKLDVSKLSKSEQDRLKMIQKLTKEADELATQAGFDLSSDDDIMEKSVGDTNWSGQSTADSVVASENNWSDLSSRLGLALGDFFALLLFAAIGRSNHEEGLNIIEILGTAGPFLLSYFIISPFLGAFNRNATASMGQVPVSLLPGWGVAMIGALSLRGFLKGAVPPTPFIIVSLVATFVLLATWRCLYIGLFGSTSDDEYRKSGAFEIFRMVGTLVKRW